MDGVQGGIAVRFSFFKGRHERRGNFENRGIIWGYELWSLISKGGGERGGLPLMGRVSSIPGRTCGAAGGGVGGWVAEEKAAGFVLDGDPLAVIGLRQG